LGSRSRPGALGQPQRRTRQEPVDCPATTVAAPPAPASDRAARAEARKDARPGAAAAHACARAVLFVVSISP
jgi:hypothetical protein